MSFGTNRRRSSPISRRTLLASLAATVAVAVGAAGCAVNSSPGSTTQNTNATGGEVFPAAQIQPLVNDLPHKTVKPLGTKRLAAGLVPPTNR
jgi:endo-1,3(4)-beta-glucanase